MKWNLYLNINNKFILYNKIAKLCIVTGGPSRFYEI